MLSMPVGFTAVDLYEELDGESDPLSARCYKVRGVCGEVYVTVDCDEDGTAIVGGMNDTKVRLLAWPSNVVSQHVRSVYRDARHLCDDARAVVDFSAAAEKMPTPPLPAFRAADINKMEPFSGVYVSWDDDGNPHYVGESKDVPSRVKKTRPEIGDRRIGVIRCDPEHRRRIECYLIGLLNPPGNSQSTHRMSSSSE